jgi:hypothetical protein
MIGLRCHLPNHLFHPLPVQVQTCQIAAGIPVDHTVGIGHGNDDDCILFDQILYLYDLFPYRLHHLPHDMRTDHFPRMLPCHEQQYFLMFGDLGILYLDAFSLFLFKLTLEDDDWDDVARYCQDRFDYIDLYFRIIQLLTQHLDALGQH